MNFLRRTLARAVIRSWPWVTDVATMRAISGFFVEDRWSSFRIIQQTVTIAMVLMLVGALRSRSEFRSDGRFSTYVALLVVAVGMNVVLYAAMERRARRAAPRVASAIPEGIPEMTYAV